MADVGRAGQLALRELGLGPEAGVLEAGGVEVAAARVHAAPLDIGRGLLAQLARVDAWRSYILHV